MVHDLITFATGLIHELVALATGLAWPAVVLVAVIVFRAQLPVLVRAITQQGFKVSGGGVSLEVNPAKAAALPETALADLGKPLLSGLAAASGTNALESLLQPSDPLDYAIIDLGTGNSWLTSRVFLFAVLLQRMRGVKEFVFVQTSGGVGRWFLGHAPVEGIRWRLAQRQDWLESAYAGAYAKLWPQPVGQVGPNVISDSGRLDYRSVLTVIGNYLTAIQSDNPAAMPGDTWIDLAAPPPGAVGQWKEHATWLDGPSLQNILACLLVFDPVEDSPDLSPADRTARIMRRKSPFVALVNRAGQFQELIDRQQLLDQLSSKAVS